MAHRVRTIALVVLIILPVLADSQWKQISGLDFSRDFAVIGTMIFAGTGGGVAMFADSGAHWSRTTLVSNYINALIARRDTLFAAVQNTVYLSADSGLTWTQRTNGLPANVYVNVLATDGSLVFAGTAAHGLYLTSDDGAHWFPASIPLRLNSVMAVTIVGSLVVVGTGDGVFRSADHGQTWTSANTGLPGSVNSFARHDSTLFACISYLGRVFLSRDQGNSWVAACSLSTVFTITCDGKDLILGTSNHGVFVSGDDGASLHPINDGLAEGNIWTVAVIDGYLFAGGPGVWRRPVAEVTSMVTGIAGDLPRSIPVVRNFPNPFNASTTIAFDLPGHEALSLAVFDRLGREVTDLFRGVLPAGPHAFVWTADRMSSGVYFYRLTYGRTMLTGKAILLK